ncbi:ankyrin repeat-containing domain protein [Scenedesmus sp. NREL 46B-D3]|nr:ankyrin repeat-containing domain protein [Scenedesmus sp. NREL 46B-D3]
MEQTGLPVNVTEAALQKPVDEVTRPHSPDVGGKVALDQSCSHQQLEDKQQQHLVEGGAQQQADNRQQPINQACHTTTAPLYAEQLRSRCTAMEPAAAAAAAAAVAPLPPLPRDACLAWVEAAKEGDIRELHQLLHQHPCLLNYQPPSGLQCTALHWAAARGHTDALQGLLLWGADPCVLTCTGSTPLHSAAAGNRLECAELLLRVPAVLQQLDWANDDGLTPAALALKHGHKLMQGMLLQAAEAAAAGRPVSSHAALASQVTDGAAHAPAAVPVSGAAAVAGGGTSRSMQAALTQQQRQQPGLQGWRPGFLLSDAARRQQVLSSSEEEEEGASQGSGSSSPRCRSSEGAALPVSVAGDSSPMVAQQAIAAADEGQLPLQQNLGAAAGDAAAAGSSNGSRQQQASMGSSSIAAGAAAGVDRQLGRSWLDAARAGDLRLLQAMAATYPQLLAYCGLGTSYALIGNSALHWCAAKGHMHCLEWLLQQGAARVSTLRNQADATALHTAAEHGQAACARLLVLRGGADVQQLDGLGQSAVQAAAGVGHQVLAQQLMLWELVLQMAGTDRSSWPVGSMQQVLRLAGRASNVAACVERHELQAAALAVVRKTMQGTEA